MAGGFWSEVGSATADLLRDIRDERNELGGKINALGGVFVGLLSCTVLAVATPVALIQGLSVESKWFKVGDDPITALVLALAALIATPLYFLLCVSSYRGSRKARGHNGDASEQDG